MLKPAPSYYRDRLCKTLLAVALLVNAFCFPAQAYAEEERLPETVAIESLLSADHVVKPLIKEEQSIQYWALSAGIQLPFRACISGQLLRYHNQLARLHLKLFSTSQRTLQTNLLLPIIITRSSIDEPVFLS